MVKSEYFDESYTLAEFSKYLEWQCLQMYVYGKGTNLANPAIKAFVEASAMLTMRLYV